MKTHLTDLNLPTSVWQALHRVDNLLGQTLSWPQRLEEINGILIDELKVDAIWLLTITPLPTTACGSMCTPLTVAPDAKVHIVDKAPPVDDDWPTPDSLLGQVMVSREPRFIEPKGALPSETDSDLGDVFFGAFNAIPSAVVPLVAEGSTIGALIVGSYNLDKIPPPGEAQNLLCYLGEHVGMSLRNAHLVEYSRRQTNALQTLNLIAHTITSSLDIDKVIHRTMAGINALLNVEAGSLLLVDEEQQDLYFKITLRGENRQITSFRLQLDEGLAGWVVTHNHPVISNNPRWDQRFSKKIDNAIGFQTKTVLCVPLTVHGKAIGALEVLNKTTGEFDEADQELLVSMSSSLGIALENANLYQAMQERAKRSEMISQITTTVNAGRGLAEIGKLIFEQLTSVIPFDHISLSLLDDSKRNIRQWLLTEHGALAYSKSLIPLADSALAQIVENEQAQIYDDISRLIPPYPDDQALLDDDIKSKIAIPLITKMRPYGSFNLGRRQPDAYRLSDLHLLEQVISQIAVAVEKSRVIDAITQHNTELKGLTHFSEMLASTIDLGLIVDTALSMIPRLLPGDVQGLIIAGEQGNYLGVAVPFDFDQTERVITDIQNTFLEINEGQLPTELIYSKNLAGNMPVPADWQPVTVLHLPIITRLGTLGIIYVASGENETLSDEMWHTFSLIASQISAAVENARLFRQVEQGRARLEAILASSTDAILVVNRNGQIVLDNPTAWEVMGVEESQSDRMLSEITNNQTLIDLFERAMQGGQPTGEIPLSDGRTFFANLSPVSANDLEVIGSVATMQDVSHFKELNQLKTDFVNSVSHDLRSPLSGILIAVHLMSQMGEVNDIQSELLETIEGRVSVMSRLIDDLLDVSKIEAGIDMDLEPRALSTITREVTTSLIPLARDKSIHLLQEFPETPITALVNATRIRQVIHNLVANAIKYTPDGGQVTVKVFEQDNETRIQVIDTGVGIPASDQPHIFEKFYRVRGDHVEGIKGTGLGLAIAQGIIEKHHGRIWLESVFGEGSTFTVALPTYEEVPQP